MGRAYTDRFVRHGKKREFAPAVCRVVYVAVLSAEKREGCRPDRLNRSNFSKFLKTKDLWGGRNIGERWPDQIFEKKTVKLMQIEVNSVIVTIYALRGEILEGWQSGRMRRTRNPVYGYTVSWVQIPPLPPRFHV